DCAGYAALAVPVALAAPGRDPRPSTTADRLAAHRAEAPPPERLGWSTRFPSPRSRRRLWSGREAATSRPGHPGPTGGAPVALAEWICGEAHRLGLARMPRPHNRVRRIAPPQDHD